MFANKVSTTNPYVLLSLPPLFWAGNAIAGKLAVGHISPFTLTTARWGFACLLMFTFALPYLKRDWVLIRKHIIFLCVCGGIGFTLFNNFLYLALNHTSAINAAIEQASMPLTVFVMNFILYKTKTTLFQLIGFGLTLIGIVITAARGDLYALVSGDLNIGDLLMIVAITFYGFYSVILKNKPDIHLVSFITIASIAAFFISLPFTLYEANTDNFIFPDLQGFGVVIYAALFPSFVAQSLWVLGLEKVGSNRGGLFINLVPIFGTILAIIILGEKFEYNHAIGAVLVLGGIMLAQKMSAKDKAASV